MTDRFEIPLETSAGQRGPGSFGEKMGIAIAVIALLGGAFILGGKMLHRDDAVAAASSSPAVRAAPPTLAPTAAPTPRVFSVDAGPLPPAPHQSRSGFTGWIRALEDLPVRSAPSSGANQVGALARGEAAYVDEIASATPDGITWLHLDEWSGGNGGTDGLVAANRGTKDLVRRYAAPLVPSGAWLNGIAAGPGQFLAYGYRPSDASGSSEPFMIQSPDGRTWEPVSLAAFGGSLPERVIYGPAGWLAVGIVASTDGNSNGVWLWRSSDGIHWNSLGRVNGTQGYYPSQLVANGDGYELVLDTGRRSSEAAWHSSDGLTWTESLGFTGGASAIVATRTGFYALPFDTTGGGPFGLPSAGLRSAEGVSWAPVTDGPAGRVAGIVALRDGLLAIDASPVTGAPRVWMRARADDASGWFRMPDLPESSGTAVAVVAGDGQRVVAVGWEQATVEPVVWTGDGTRWERTVLPAGAFGGAIPTQVAANAGGMIAIGSAPTLQAENPVIWQAPTGGAWRARAVPELAKVGEATAAHCPASPSDVIELLVLPVPRAIACFGHAQMTVRAWLTTCDGCAGVGPGQLSPGWLLGPDMVGISPVQGQQDMQARLIPGIAADPRWQSQPVEITGHYDDPLATSCRYIPDVIAGGSPISRADLVNQCRQTFIITRVRTLPAG